MKRVLQLAGILAVITFATWTLLPGGASQAASGPRDAAERYAEAVKSQEWSKAYTLTSNNFRQVIPEDAFARYFEPNAGLSAAYEVVDTKTLSETRAQVEIKAPGAQQTGVIELSFEAGEWRVQPDWRQFYSTKLDLLPDIHSLSEGETEVTLRYILESRGNAEEAEYTLVCLGINNNGNNEVRWELPAPGSGDGYLLDPATEASLQPSFAYSVVADADQDFHFIPMPGPGTMLLGSGAKATLYVHFDGLLPSAVERVDLFLAGLASVSDGQPWAVRMDGLPYRPEVVPSE